MAELDPTARRRHKLRNLAQAVALLGGMALMLGVVAWLLFGPAALLWFAAAGAVSALFRPRVPAAWILRMYGASPLPEHAAPEVHRYVRVLAGRAGLPTAPGIFYVRTPVLNAFAVGRRRDPALTVTDGLLRRLTARELVGVLAHETAHIRSNDLWIMGLSDTVGRLTHLLAYAGVFVLVLTIPVTFAGTLWPLATALALTSVPTFVTLLQLALSRSREYDADLDAAALTGDPVGLASALRTLHRHEGRIWERMMVPRGRMPDPLLLRTHPPTEERIRRLLELAPRPRPPLGHDRPAAPRDRPRAEGPVRLRPPGVWW